MTAFDISDVELYLRATERGLLLAVMIVLLCVCSLFRNESLLSLS